MRRVLGGRVPSVHLMRASLHAARLLDRSGAAISTAHHTYTRYPSDGLFPPDDLKQGEALLIAADLAVQSRGRLLPTPELMFLVSQEESEALALLFSRILDRLTDQMSAEVDVVWPGLLAAVELQSSELGRSLLLQAAIDRFEAAITAQVGALGEELVASVTRQELEALGFPKLAQRVQIVSKISDSFGYDVFAPSIVGSPRHFEVKTSARASSEDVSFYLTRNELEVGRRDRRWALIVCRYRSPSSTSILGWCNASALESLVPSDSDAGTWRTAKLAIPLAALAVGIPSAA